MKPDEQRKTIANVDGWTTRRVAVSGGNPPLELWLWFGPNGEANREAPPDYLNDLNAMHGAEKVLTDEQYGPNYAWEAPHHHTKNTDKSYAWTLWKIVENSYTEEQRPCKVRVESATAAQRAEAFLRTLGLWVEE